MVLLDIALTPIIAFIGVISAAVIGGFFSVAVTRFQIIPQHEANMIASRNDDSEKQSRITNDAMSYAKVKDQEVERLTVKVQQGADRTSYLEEQLKQRDTTIAHLSEQLLTAQKEVTVVRAEIGTMRLQNAAEVATLRVQINILFEQMAVLRQKEIGPRRRHTVTDITEITNK